MSVVNVCCDSCGASTALGHYVPKWIGSECSRANYEASLSFRDRRRSSSEIMSIVSHDFLKNPEIFS